MDHSAAGDQGPSRGVLQRNLSQHTPALAVVRGKPGHGRRGQAKGPAALGVSQPLAQSALHQRG